MAVGPDEPVGPSVDAEESGGAACATEAIVACPPHHNTAPIPAPATAARTLRVEPLHLVWVIVLPRSSCCLGHCHSSVMGKPRVGLRAIDARAARARTADDSNYCDHWKAPSFGDTICRIGGGYFGGFRRGMGSQPSSTALL